MGEKRLPIDMIADHQIEHLQEAEKHGAVSFLIVEIRATREVFIVVNEQLQKYVERAKNCGRKSISLDELQTSAYPVKSQNGVPLDYLSVVDQMLEAKSA